MKEYYDKKEYNLELKFKYSSKHNNTKAESITFIPRYPSGTIALIKFSQPTKKTFLEQINKIYIRKRGIFNEMVKIIECVALLEDQDKKIQNGEEIEFGCIPITIGDRI